MPEPLSYEEKVVKTFRKTALRTVLMIDDQFPTFSDLAQVQTACNVDDKVCGLANLDKRFTERQRARRLYEMFRKHDMPCDIENTIDDIETKSGVERIRKSDLVVLDYNLDGSIDDNRKSIGLILRLAETSHFNTVVLYTGDPKLEQVWFDVAIFLKGGWKDSEDLLEGNALELWEKFSDEETLLPEISNELVKRYLVAGVRALGPERDPVVAELKALGVDKESADAFIEALIHRAVRERLADRASTTSENSRPIAGRCEEGHPLWLQAGNCFIAIMGKNAVGADGVQIENDDIIGYLDAALKDWRPNLLQLVISEIQNMLELESLATDEMHLLNPEIQAGLFYYLLQRIGGLPIAADGAPFTPGIEAIIDRLVDSIRRKISANELVASGAACLLASELTAKGWPPAVGNDRAVFDFAAKIAGLETPPDVEETIFKLNSFLNTEEFKRGHITTGSIIRVAGEGPESDHWICLSPACDMEDREPSPGTVQRWVKDIFPVRAFVIVRLDPKVNHMKAMKTATEGYTIFVENADGKHAFSVLAGVQPSYEFLFPAEAGRVSFDAELPYPQFKAFRLRRPPNAESFRQEALAEVMFEVVGQVREQYASRFLQVVGQHLSRIGVDYINIPRG